MMKVITAATLFVAAFCVQAQVEIVESKPIGVRGKALPAASAADAPAVDNQMQNELYFQLQTLQQEVQELRGLVEEQSFELKRLKQQRLDDYLDLDRRLSQLGQTTSKPTPNIVSSNNLAVVAANDPTPPKDELASYRSAIDLVLKKRDFDAGASALLSYLDDFPKGHYVANAQYWLGQIYFQKDDLEKSQKWFGQMIQEFPQHQKAEEAKFKLAKVLYSAGDQTKAKVLLNEVAGSDSSVAALAKDFLKTLP